MKPSNEVAEQEVGYDVKQETQNLEPLVTALQTLFKQTKMISTSLVEHCFKNSDITAWNPSQESDKKEALAAIELFKKAQKVELYSSEVVFNFSSTVFKAEKAECSIPITSLNLWKHRKLSLMFVVGVRLDEGWAQSHDYPAEIWIDRSTRVPKMLFSHRNAQGNKIWQRHNGEAKPSELLFTKEYQIKEVVFKNANEQESRENGPARIFFDPQTLRVSGSRWVLNGSSLEGRERKKEFKRAQEERLKIGGEIEKAESNPIQKKSVVRTKKL